MGKYDDIMNISYPSPEIEKDFPERVLRAAQFTPFAALTGYDEAVIETARITDSKRILFLDVKEEINRKLIYLKDNLEKCHESMFRYFVPDSKKDGGKYVTKIGTVKKICEHQHMVVLDDGTNIPVSDILEINSDFFLPES